mgnify:CR=1 FL=1
MSEKIKNGVVVEIYQDNEEDTEKVVSILKQYFRVRETNRKLYIDPPQRGEVKKEN